MNNNLPAWRNVMPPRNEVASGDFKTADFAADLSRIGDSGGEPSYLDAKLFFRMTYLTDGMKGLLAEALRRVSGNGGDPVIQLKTAFGGGKTHSMFALYHFFGGTDARDMDGAAEVLARADVPYIPKVNTAVFVGTAEGPASSHDVHGVKVNTVWGEIAVKLAHNAGDMGLFELVRESDERSTSPGSRVLRELFDSCGPCMVLIDEIVAYARKLRDEPGLPAGTFDNFQSFIQEITEAAKMSRNSVVIASIPESNNEIGGESGQKVLQKVEHTFGRIQSIWKPVEADDGFEIVRRRLFHECKDPNARERVANAFSGMYAENKRDFPAESCGMGYRDKIISCYPVHPEIFERLYGDWSTLEKFQRTRGVLRLMAEVVHELWTRGDTSPLIMPGSIPLDAVKVRDELLRALPSDGWHAIADTEIDGVKSRPKKIDDDIQRFGKISAARRVSRAIMLGSAPGSRSQAVRGIEKAYIRLGVVQPDESIADFNDALSTLQSELAYLYSDTDGTRFWYDTRPTLRKTVADRKKRVPDDDVRNEIIRRLKKFRSERPFAGVHVCPSSSLDVPDEMSARLVILGPEDSHKQSGTESPAEKKCAEILSGRGDSPRYYQNMLMFLAPDKGQIDILNDKVREYLAWKGVDDEKDILNLDARQTRETRDNIAGCNAEIDARISEAWIWILAPKIDTESDIKTVIWEKERVRSGNASIIAAAAKCLKDNDLLAVKIDPSYLKEEVLDKFLWKDSDNISVKTLWECLCRYCYLTRLADYGVLKESIASGVKSGVFALSDSFADGKYDGLKYECELSGVSDSAYLVKKETAVKILQPEIPPESVKDSGHDTPPENHKPGTESTPPKLTVHRNFHMSAEIDPVRLTADAKNFYDNVIRELNDHAGRVRVTLEIEAVSGDGFPQDFERDILANCVNLKAANFGFE